MSPHFIINKMQTRKLTVDIITCASFVKLIINF